MLSHSVTTLYTAAFSIIYILFNIKKLKEKDIFIKCIINAIFILLVSIMFWLPLLEVTYYADYAIMDATVMKTNGEFASKNTISFMQLVKDKGEENGTTFLIGLPTIISIFLTIFVCKHVDNKYKEYYLISIIFALTSIFMTSMFFPWRIMPDFICKLQYPWRMIGFFNFFISFVCAINLEYIIKKLFKKDIFRMIFIMLFIILSIIDSISIMSQFFTTDNTLDQKYETKTLDNRRISHKQINRDYMPLKALYLQNKYVQDREDKTYILEGNAKILEERKENLKDEIKIENVEKDTVLEFPYYYYVGYKIKLETENEVKEVNAIESKHGYLSCIIEEDVKEGTIIVEYVGTIITYSSYIISAISLIIFIGYIICERKKGEENV